MPPDLLPKTVEICRILWPYYSNWGIAFSIQTILKLAHEANIKALFSKRYKGNI